MRKIFYLILVMLSFSCSEISTDDEVSELEKANAYLEAKEYQNAIDSYTIVISENSEDYVSYRKLAASYAGLGGFNLMDVLADSLTEVIEAASEGDDTADLVSELLADALPNPPSDAQLAAILESVNVLNRIPDTVDTDSSDYGTLEIQKVIYIAAYAIVFANYFNDAAGSLDPDKLSQMSVEQAEQFVEVLESLDDPVVNSILDEVNSQPGADTSERVQNYIDSLNS